MINWQAILDEDCPRDDISTVCLGLSDTVTTTAYILSKAPGIFYCGPCLHELAKRVDPQLRVNQLVADGTPVPAMTRVIAFTGSATSILRLERPLLNLIQHLSGIATTTQQFVQALANPDIAIVDTRKTTPLLRSLEKAAVIAGGGYNHRLNLSDMILLKENHIMALHHHYPTRTIGTVLKHARQTYPNYQIEIEISQPNTLTQWDLSDADIIMFDNFSFSDSQAASTTCRVRYPHALLEISGNITQATIHQYGELPIDRIAIGRLTHSVTSIDMSLLIT